MQVSNNHTFPETKNIWFPLDNAAKIFPAVVTGELTTVFRISVVLKNRIRINNLLNAVNRLRDRFPYYMVHLKKGFFWYYLERADHKIAVEFENTIPCRKFEKENYLFRILAVKNRLSVEFSHILTDGTGAYEFLKSLVMIYVEECGTKPSPESKFRRPGELVPKEEFEDSYNKYFKEKVPSNVRLPRAFHLPFPLNSIPRLKIINAIVSSADIKMKAKEKGVNITVYLISLHLLVLQDIYENLRTLNQRRRSQIRIQVPVNLRNIYSSVSMRNFSLFVMPGIDLRLGHYTFDEILKTVFHQIQLETDEKLVNKIIARNVSNEKKLLVRSIPLFIKSYILRYKYFSLGSNQYSGVVTNLGKVDFPSGMNDYIDYFIFTPPPPNKRLKISCGIIGFNDTLVISFGNITKSKDFERKFLKHFINEGIKIKLINYNDAGQS